jgi:hypothetical protein
MNDDFLTRFRKSPSREFSAALYERIKTPMITQKKFPLRRFTFAAALVLALFVALTFSPSARARLLYIFKVIGGVTYEQEDDAGSPGTPLPESQVTIVPEDYLSLEEARGKVPFEIHLPTWLPDGSTMIDTVRISYFGPRYTPVEIKWTGPDPKLGYIILSVGQPVHWEVDLEHVQAVKINGQPAGLTGGDWDADTGQWSADDLTLTWLRGDVQYRLSYRGDSADTLIRMAESIP